MPEQVMDAEIAEEGVSYCETCGYGRRFPWPSYYTPHDTEDHPCDVCDVCDEYVLDDHTIRYGPVCDRCDYHTCDCECDAQDDEYVHDWAYQPEEIIWHGLVAGVPTLDATAGRNGSAHNYRPPRDNQPYLGLEVETEAVGGSPRAIAEVWTDSGMGWCKTDGSLSSSGVECVSHPFTYARLEHDDKLPNVLRGMKGAGARAWEPGHCGLHIHVSRQSFAGKPHQWRFAAAHEAMSNELRLMAGRGDEVGYCKWVPENVPVYVTEGGHVLTDNELAGGMPRSSRVEYIPQTAKKVIAGKVRNHDRYVSVNVTSRTIELRFWRGSLSVTHVMGAAALADAIQQWTREMSVATVRRDLTGSQANAWLAFQTWAIDHLPQQQLQRIHSLADRRGVCLSSAMIEAATAAKGGEA